MSDQPTTPAPAAAGAPVPTAPATTSEPVATAPTDAPPWGSDFDAEKAWSLVQNLRADKEKLAKRESLTPEQKQRLAEFDRLEQASQTELERAQKAAETNATRAQALLDRAVKAEVKAAAQGFADPEDAAAFLDLKAYATESGDIDSERIQADLADLLARKPHLGKLPDNRVPAPNPAQGSSGSGGTNPTQLSSADVSRMYAEKDYAGIEKARVEGRLANVLGG